MEIYRSPGTNKLPEINFDPLSGIFEIKGRSIPEHPIEFYQPVVDHISAYSAATLPKCLVSVYLEYFNTSSSRCIFVILKKFKELSRAGAAIEIHWAYEESDEEMLETAQVFEELLELKFKIISVPSK